MLFVGSILLTVFFMSFGVKISSSVSRISVSLTDALLLFFIFLYGLTAFFSSDKFSAFLGLYGYNHGGFIFAAALALLFCLVSRHRWNINRLEIFSFAVVLAMAASLFTALNEFPFSFSDYIFRIRLFGPQFHPVAYGIYLMVGFFIALSLIFLWQRKTARLAAVAIATLILLVIISNATRSVWVAAGLALSTVFFCAWKFDPLFKSYMKQSTGKILTVTAVFLAVSAGVLQVWTKPGERVINAWDPQKDSSVSIRLLEWQTAWEVIKNNSLFLGPGPESVRFTYPLYRPAVLNDLKEGDLEIASVRNVYLNYAANVGMAPAVIFVFFLGTVLTGTVRWFYSSRLPERERRVIFLFFGAWLSLVIINIFYHYTVTSAIFLWALSGILVSKIKEEGFIPVKDFPVKMSAAIKILARIVIFILVFGGLVLLAEILRTEELFSRGVSAKDSPAGIKLIKESLALIPWDSRKLQVLGLREQLTEDSLKHLQQALKLSPQDATTHNAIGSVYFKAYLNKKERRFLEEGLPYALRAFELYPSRELYADNIGEYFLALGQLDKAEQFFRQAVSLRKDYFLGFYHLGEVNKQKGKFDQAKKWYLDSLRHGGYPLFVKEKVAEIESLRGQD